MNKFVLLNDSDNVLVCCQAVEAGETCLLGDVLLVLTQPIAVGHKIARTALSRGDKIIKYGAAIGTATRDCAPGAHVHLHNMKSDYIPSHTRGVTGQNG